MMTGLQVHSNEKSQGLRRCGTVLLGLATLFACMFVAIALASPGSALAASDAADLAAATPSAADSAAQPAKAKAKYKKPTKAEWKSFKKASADFAFDLFNRSVKKKGKNENVTVAPMSVMTALALAGNGAVGKTSAQLRNVIADGASMATIDNNLRWFNKKLVNTDKASLSSANSIWYHDSPTLAMKKRFLDVNRKYLDADVNSANFSDPSTLGAINSWVAEKTNNMIKQVLGQLDESDRLVLVNALYFDAKWLAPFDADSVHDREFTAANGEKRTVKMMYDSEHSYIETSNATGFVKPYAAGYSYVALLPKEGTSVKNLVASLDGSSFRKLVNKAQRTTVHVGLPKYEVSYTDENMANVLKDMGIKLAFNPGKANFKKMGTDSTGNLFLDQVVHKTKLKLDENGTKAAAVTAITVKANSIAIDPKTVILDRPFVYAIVDNSTKLPIFMGTVNDIK